MKTLLLVVLVVVLAAAGAAVYLHPAWLARIRGDNRAALSHASNAAGGKPVHGDAQGNERPPAAAAADMPATAPAAAPDAAPASSLPFTESATNVAAEDVGGHVEEVTGSYGSGYFGRRLIDGAVEPLWTASNPVTFPQEAIFSFYGRQRALISAVTIVLPGEAASAPRDVEVWTSAESAPDAFVKAAAQTLAPQPAEQKIVFAPVEARYVKLRILSAAASDRVALPEVRILEALRAGYAPLLTRNPEIASWKRSPRQAAQLGLDWLQQAAVDWQKKTQCFGCHVQAQVIMGQAIAMKQDYSVSRAALAELEKGTRQYQDEAGSWFGGFVSPTQFGVMALAYADENSGKLEDPGFLKGVDWLVTKQAQDGSFPVDRLDAPIVQGSFMTTANTLIALKRAHEVTGDSKYTAAAGRALAWIAANQPETTQDRVFKVLALTRFGTPSQKPLVTAILEQLARAQQADGGWKEHADTKGSNALATGQVLYAFKQGGASIHSPVFRRGVKYLLETQVHDTHTETDGAWAATNTQSGRPSDFGHTMWPVIGLAGSYGVSKTGGLQVVTDLRRDKPPSRNLEIVLDASGSMKLALGSSTRWQTALGVLDRIVATLPDDFNVGLRVYGHRYSSRSPQTCTDSELVVPVARLDRQRIVTTARRLQPRGETPLVWSVLQTIADLRGLGNGSVVLITDGEESCKGNAKTAAGQLKASGVDLTLNIVGFTLKGKATEEELGLLAQATGGRYYGAQNGDQLARALTLASVQSLSYKVYDSAGTLVSSGATGSLGAELPPGSYRVVVDALGRELEENVNVVADSDVVVKVALLGDQFVIQR